MKTRFVTAMVSIVLMVVLASAAHTAAKGKPGGGEVLVAIYRDALGDAGENPPVPPDRVYSDWELATTGPRGDNPYVEGASFGKGSGHFILDLRRENREVCFDFSVQTNLESTLVPIPFDGEIICREDVFMRIKRIDQDGLLSFEAMRKDDAPSDHSNIWWAWKESDGNQWELSLGLNKFGNTNSDQIRIECDLETDGKCTEWTIRPLNDNEVEASLVVLLKKGGTGRTLIAKYEMPFFLTVTRSSP
jgi:hypothetical protein